MFQAAFHLENQRVVNVNAVCLETLEIIQCCSRRGETLLMSLRKRKKKTHKGFFNHMKEEQF